MRLILDPPASGTQNMATDEALLMCRESLGMDTLRFYRWEEPTLSLGYFQRYDDRKLHSPSLQAPCVRRRTGGGAIVHHHELTYSIVIETAKSMGADEGLYDSVHQALIDVLLHWGKTTSMAGEDSGEQAFLCFQRRTPKDVVFNGHKILGSAQRRKRRSLLQHGSLLVQLSPVAPELTGVFDDASQLPSYDELATAWSERLADSNDWQLEPGPLAEDEIRAQSDAAARYSDPNWTKSR